MMYVCPKLNLMSNMLMKMPGFIRIVFTYSFRPESQLMDLHRESKSAATVVFPFHEQSQKYTRHLLLHGSWLLVLPCNTHGEQVPKTEVPDTVNMIIISIIS